MSNPEFEPDIVKSIDANGFSEKQLDLQVDTKDTARQQVKQVNDLKGQRSGTITLGKKKKEPEVIFKR
jgi:hypothetical protein